MDRGICAGIAADILVVIERPSTMSLATALTRMRKIAVVRTTELVGKTRPKVRVNNMGSGSSDDSDHQNSFARQVDMTERSSIVPPSDVVSHDESYEHDAGHDEDDDDEGQE